jgi:hypothetical protein
MGIVKKQQKYINYIVSDLVRKTETDWKTGKVVYPYTNEPVWNVPETRPNVFAVSTPKFITRFPKLMSDTYGVREEEVEMIWDLYKERIKSLFY